MTNKEWLLKEMQNMSDEEFAKKISTIDVLCEEQKDKCTCGRICFECKTEWLKQEHKEKIELSEAERVILTNINTKYGWIVRDEDGELNIFEAKPFKTDECNGWNNIEQTLYESLSAFNHLFEFVKWEDIEPYNIEELLKSSEDED